MVWRFVTPVGIGDSQRFGGADINKIMQLFSGVADVDTVSINSNWFFQNNRLAILSPDGQSSSALQVDNVPTGPGVQRTTIIPSQEQATDYISIRKQTEELEHNKIDGCNAWKHSKKRRKRHVSWIPQGYSEPIATRKLSRYGSSMGN